MPDVDFWAEFWKNLKNDQDREFFEFERENKKVKRTVLFCTQSVRHPQHNYEN